MKEVKDVGLRITQQFRSGRAMVYDLRDETSRLTLTIAARQSPDDPGDFRVDAATGGATDALAFTGWGPTRADALREAGRSWAQAQTTVPLPVFDWDVVARVLHAVRAV